MKRETSPVDARAGAVSGRIFLVLISSFFGAVIALGLCWAFLLPR
jgi:hypothetical protein